MFYCSSYEYTLQRVGKSWINYNQCEVSDVGERVRKGKFYNRLASLLPWDLLLYRLTCREIVGGMQKRLRKSKNRCEKNLTKQGGGNTWVGKWRKLSITVNDRSRKSAVECFTYFTPIVAPFRGRYYGGTGLCRHAARARRTDTVTQFNVRCANQSKEKQRLNKTYWSRLRKGLSVALK